MRIARKTMLTNRMTEQAKINALANRALMQVNAQGGTIVFVEGQSDPVVYRPLLKVPHKGNIIPAKGRLRVQRAVAQAADPRIIGIVDADFDRPLGRKCCQPGIFITDCHDAETTAISTDALGAVLKDYRVSLSVDKVRNILKRVALPFGRLRCGNEQFKWNADLDGLVSDQLIVELSDPLKWEVDHALLAKEAHKRLKPTMQTTFPEQQLQDYADGTAIVAHADEWDICHGHDLGKLLTLLINFDTQSTYTPEQVEHRLRDRYSQRLDLFRRTRMHCNLHKWEQQNKKKVLFSFREPCPWVSHHNCGKGLECPARK